MMFSDVVGVANALLSLHPGAFAPLLMFVLIFWIAGKLFRAVVLEGHPFVLAVAALGSYAFAGQMVDDGQYVLAIIFAVPLLFIGKEAYRRLVAR